MKQILVTKVVPNEIACVLNPTVQYSLIKNNPNPLNTNDKSIRKFPKVVVSSNNSCFTPNITRDPLAS